MHGVAQVPPESEERVLSTLNRDGSRHWLRPRPAHGRFLRRRQLVGYGLIALFTLLPFARVGGKPAILLDLGRREFTFFGTTLLATDTLLLALMLLSIFVTIFLLTALFGRVWCGWGCPQTVYLELVYRPIERLFEGRHYRTGGKSPVHPARMLGKYAAFLFVSLGLAHTFLAYFVGTGTLWQWMRQSPLSHPSGFLIVFFVTALMMVDFAYMREQVCILMCPYGRFQSALLDRQSLIVTYDPGRGEPRGKRRKGQSAGFGDCIDCAACVTCCPTGIDIRDGLQMECVSCTQCIDACDTVMDRIGKPRGLIRYSSQEAIETDRRRLWRFRVVVYPLILATTLSLFGLTLAGKQDFDVTPLRTRNATFTRNDDGTVENIVMIKVQNRTESTRNYTIELQQEGHLAGADRPLSLGPKEQGEFTLHVSLPFGAFKRGRTEALLLLTEVETGETKAIEHRVLGPLYGGAGAEEAQPGGEERP